VILYFAIPTVSANITLSKLSDVRILILANLSRFRTSEEPTTLSHNASVLAGAYRLTESHDAFL
jgi:hypothetical protein